MNKLPLKVLITAAGSGSRLGEFAKYSNKTLIRVGKKPVISYIIDAYPKDTQFIVTLGHFGNHVKDFLNLAYPNHSFTFVPVDTYDGPGSCLGYTMLQALPYLQSPFIYHASDTIIAQRVPNPDINWIAGFNGEGSSNYTSFNILNGKIQKIMEKGIFNPDYLHIGLVGIHDYVLFWKSLKKLHKKNIFAENFGDVQVLNDLIDNGVDFKIKEFTTWLDTGNSEALKKAKEAFKNLDKLDESVFILNEKSVIKFYSDTHAVKQRVQRSKILKKLVPKIVSYRDNFFSYKYIKGELYADVANSVNFLELLNWSKKNLWKSVREVSDKKFKEVCFDFYYSKTNERITRFLTSRGIKDSKHIINDEEVPTVKELLKKVDFDWLTNTKQTGFRGDFIADNIMKTKKGFVLLDWRNNFGGLLKAGDMYYDLAKLNHNLTVSHKIISENLFTIKISGDTVMCDILRKENLVQCQNRLFTFLGENKLDAKKVKILTSFVWFSSSPLHHHPYDQFLFYFAKLNLWRILNEK